METIISIGEYWYSGKENGNRYSILGIYWDNGNENGNYYSLLGLYWKNGKENGNYWECSDYVKYSPPNYTLNPNLSDLS